MVLPYRVCLFTVDLIQRMTETFQNMIDTRYDQNSDDDVHTKRRPRDDIQTHRLRSD